jgi:hypothetical protein
LPFCVQTHPQNALTRHGLVFQGNAPSLAWLSLLTDESTNKELSVPGNSELILP